MEAVITQERRTSSSRAAREAVAVTLRKSKVATLKRRIAAYEQGIQHQKDEVTRLSALIATRGRIVETEGEARVALALVGQRSTARRELARLAALRDMACERLAEIAP